MARWQTYARYVAAVVAIGGAASVYLVMGERQERPAAAPVERIDPDAAIETRGGDIIQLKGARQDVRIEFDRQVTYEDGRTKLLGVKAIIENRAGRSFVITGKEGQVGPNQSSIDLNGEVTLSASDGLTARADSATYSEAEGVVQAPGPVQFTRGRISGKGKGFTYDRQRDTVWLQEEAVISVAPADNGGGGMEVQSGSAGMARQERYLKFLGEAVLVRDGQQVEASEVTVFLLADRDEPDMIELRGNSRITGGTGMGALRAMQARDINLDYGSDGRTLERATLASQASIQLAQADGSTGQQLGADWVDISLAPDGAVTSLAARDNAQVTLPPAGDQPGRTIRARSISGSGAAGQGITLMRFDENAEFREAAARDRGVRVARARQLELRMTPGTGALDAATFTGQFRFEDGKLQATSSNARYDITKGLVALTSTAGQPRPRVADEKLVIDADTIDLTLSPRRMVANGKVSSTLQGGRAGAQGSALLQEKEPVQVVAEHLEFDEAKGIGVYKGKARLWQKDTTIQGDTITLDDAKGDLSATGAVLTAFTLEGGKPTIARAGEFVYDSAARLATYTNLDRMNGPEGELTASKVEMHLAAESNALERLEAYTGVTVKIDTRTATGARLTYHTGDERYVLAGAPVRLVEACRETAGRTLTFFRSSARLIVDGNESRAESKGGGKCPEPPRFE